MTAGDLAAVAFFGLQAASGRLLINWLDPQHRCPGAIRLVSTGVLGWIGSAYLVLGLALLTRSLGWALGLTGGLLGLGLGALAVRARPSWPALAGPLRALSAALARHPLAAGWRCRWGSSSRCNGKC